MNRYLQETIGEVRTSDGRSLAVSRGWSGVFARLLVEQSKQAEILKWTPRDATERFATFAHAQRWHENEEKMPITYALGLDKTQLAAMAWFSKGTNPEAPGARLTFGIRVYEEFSGQGLSRPFAEIVHADMDTNYRSGVWLETDTDNVPAQKLYENLGYVAVGDHGANRIVMARPPANLI